MSVFALLQRLGYGRRQVGGLTREWVVRTLGLGPRKGGIPEPREHFRRLGYEPHRVEAKAREANAHPR